MVRRRQFAVPHTAVFLGVPLSLQWAVFDPLANPLGLVTSNAVDLVIGS
ncbi:MAG: hypothetical protein KA020_03660 [Planctomycetes bacterium]|nr:hypothetical protein [Planctomycetota bacterium]MCC7062373.1 hypothetical protein [Planctomycetota bacterium]